MRSPMMSSLQLMGADDSVGLVVDMAERGQRGSRVRRKGKRVAHRLKADVFGILPARLLAPSHHHHRTANTRSL